MKFTTNTEAATYFTENRTQIAHDLDNLVFRAKNLFNNKRGLTLEDTIDIYKIVLNETLDSSRAYTAAEEFTSKSGKISGGFFLCEAAKRQLPSSMR